MCEGLLSQDSNAAQKYEVHALNEHHYCSKCSTLQLV